MNVHIDNQLVHKLHALKCRQTSTTPWCLSSDRGVALKQGDDSQRGRRGWAWFRDALKGWGGRCPHPPQACKMETREELESVRMGESGVLMQEGAFGLTVNQVPTVFVPQTMCMSGCFQCRERWDAPFPSKLQKITDAGPASTRSALLLT